MTDRIIWLDYATAAELAGPRPKTDYSKPVACPECGYVRECSKRRRCPCGQRLMGVAELRWRAEVWRRQDYEQMAAWVEGVAEALVMFEVEE